MSQSNLNPSAQPWNGTYPMQGMGGGPYSDNNGYQENGNYPPGMMNNQNAYNGQQGVYDQGANYMRQGPNSYGGGGGNNMASYHGVGGGNPNFSAQTRQPRGRGNGSFRGGAQGMVGPMPSRRGGVFNGPMGQQQPPQGPPLQQQQPPMRPFPGGNRMNMGGGAFNSGHSSPQPVPSQQQPYGNMPQQQMQHQQRPMPPQQHQMQQQAAPMSHQQMHLSHQQQQQPMPPPQQQQQQQPQQTLPQKMATREVAAPKVILVTGYRRTGKTTVAKELAKNRQYEYISLRDMESKDAAEEEDDDVPTLTERLAPLVKLLECKKSLKGIVIDDALMNNKFESYYVNSVLNAAGLRLNFVVIITTELSDLVNRGIEFNTFKEMQAHPESFEFGNQLEDANASSGGAPIAVVDGTEAVGTVVEETIKQIRELEVRNPPPLLLPAVEFVAGCELVADPALVEEVINAERVALGVDGFDYGFPYVEPNYLLDYVQFVRHALPFKHYLLAPWIWGDKVSLIGYGDNVYVHLPSYSVVFQFNEVPAELQEVMKTLAKEVTGAEQDQKPFLFSLEATRLDGVLYVSDMMLLGDRLGSKTLLPDRVQLMGERLAALKPSNGGSSIQLLDHFPVSELEKRMSDPFMSDRARGVLFVNPGVMATGNYDSRNFIYPFENKKTVQIRVWNGRVDNGMWVFDAYAREGEQECVICADETPIPVFISDEDVTEYTINDGNIVECVLAEDDVPQQQQQKGRRGAKVQSATMHFTFQKRCEWKIEPTTVYYQSAFVSLPKWPTASFLKACDTIKYQRAITEKAN